MGDRITNVFERMKDGEITNLEELHDTVHFALDIREEKFTAANTQSEQTLREIAAEVINTSEKFYQLSIKEHKDLIDKWARQLLTL